MKITKRKRLKEAMSSPLNNYADFRAAFRKLGFEDEDNFDDLIKLILDEIVEADRRGRVSLEKLDYEDFLDIIDRYFNEDFYKKVTRNNYEKAMSLIEQAIENNGVRFYDSRDMGLMIQLSDNPTVTDIYDELEARGFDDEFSVYGDDVFWEAYNFFLENAVESFETKTKVEVFLLGKSGRHVCVEFNLGNILHYDYLREIAKEEEDDLVLNMANSTFNRNESHRTNEAHRQHKKKKLKEGRWNYTLKYGKNLREAIDEGDLINTASALNLCYSELHDNGLIDDDEWEEAINRIYDAMDIEDEDELTDELDELLAEFYDFCDDNRVWVAL